MIEYLGHNLIVHDNDNIRNFWPGIRLIYKCSNCNHIIYKIFGVISDGYYHYPNGRDCDGEINYMNWELLTLTCNEEIVKGLLE